MMEDKLPVGQDNHQLVQYGLAVTDFSSQYGSEQSISYSARNLAGKSSIFPNYGDFTQACVFRTYGPWWNLVPSGKQQFVRTPPSYCSEDYIEISFEAKVYPTKIDIYETYNPGTVVRIMACDKTSGTDVDTGYRYTWKTLWEGQPESSPLRSRIFSPPLRNCPFPTDLIRLEMCHRLVDYYTELDCVMLHGTIAPVKLTRDSTIVHEECVYRDFQGDHETYMTTGMLKELKINCKEESSVVESSEVETGSGTVITSDIDSERNVSHHTDNGYFDLLPVEVIQGILNFLDFLSLCRAARTCSLLRKQCYDPLQYKELNLQPHWPQVADHAIDSLQSRCQHLQRLNLSWCSSTNLHSSDSLHRFFKSCGDSLTCLYLSSCHFVTQHMLEHLVTSCHNLRELDIESCLNVDSGAMMKLKGLTKLQRLNLYRTKVDLYSIILVIRSCPDLRMLNLGSCCNIHAYDDVARELATHCRKLQSLDVWRSKTFSDAGLSVLANSCPDLEELDLGWCSELKTNQSECILELAQKCPKLKKLFLTANRTVSDLDVSAMARYCKHLEQFDILGTRQVTADAAHRLLSCCPKLVMFDVSFCSGIEFNTVESWKREFPHVSIKKSFQN